MDTEERATISRRTLMKGAAWAVPVVAVAAAAPAWAASSSMLQITGGCAPVGNNGSLPSFTVANTGATAYTGTITVTETIDLSGAANGERSNFWQALGQAGAATKTSDASVSVGAWSPSQTGANVTSKTRTVTITTTLAPGASVSWGQVVTSASGQFPSSGTWTAAMTATNTPTISGSPATLPWADIKGCTPTITETHTYLNWNYEKSKWCEHGQTFRPDQIDGTIADGIVFALKYPDGSPIANAPVTLTLAGTSSGSFWFAVDKYQGDTRGTQPQTITLNSDANGILALDNSVPGMPVPGNDAYDNWGWLRYGSGAKSGVTLTASAAGAAPVVLTIANGSEGNNPHPGNKTRNYDGGQAC